MQLEALKPRILKCFLLTTLSPGKLLLNAKYVGEQSRHACQTPMVPNHREIYIEIFAIHINLFTKYKSTFSY